VWWKKMRSTFFLKKKVILVKVILIINDGFFRSIWFSLNKLINLLWKEFIKIIIFVMKKKIELIFFFSKKTSKIKSFRRLSIQSKQNCFKAIGDNERLNDFYWHTTEIGTIFSLSFFSSFSDMSIYFNHIKYSPIICICTLLRNIYVFIYNRWWDYVDLNSGGKYLLQMRFLKSIMKILSWNRQSFFYI